MVTGMNRLLSALKREFWRPEDPRVLVPKHPAFGLGWALNVAAVKQRLGR
jgi:hypothetical protein